MRQVLDATICLLLTLAFFGCQTLQTTPNTSPFQYQFVREQLVLHSDFLLPEKHRLIEELSLLRHQLSEKLAIPTTDEPIHVYLFSSDASYYGFLKQQFPNFPTRRAIFVETDIELAVYAHWGDHIAEDLRHEVAHGYLHAAIPNLPLWLDEGLAEYFEVGFSRKGLNQTHLDLLNAQIDLAAWQPDLDRLEQLASAAEMSQLDYAEAWAWVHYLLNSDDDKANLLTGYLADLRQATTANRLGTRIEKRLAAPQLALVEHIQMLR